ncbi:hypothetical protein [Pseudostreptobacillus hongkongensis]|uniref:hypothetical protein n=1 Tax=Pseudostreptobacillus hongkongensis TaxID=1162717 RepID=UPI000836903F|nr:hypothetical protein [Pseudostreptobacillus hongkongensis]
MVYNIKEIPKKEQPYELPEKWECVRLGDITSIISGGAPKTNIDTYYFNLGFLYLKKVYLIRLLEVRYNLLIYSLKLYNIIRKLG